ncbi:hypothetical protein DAERI_020302 [Deinococcus aerius]|uniref:Uncharacterized protein n=1 Tax=Deinococcus aerius TaxID=200253 RepID=A0A2I9DW02_9DEIO|nr:hypothetical protein [Deinococcus aerius]GBF04705.1 hypothetical protein DAERI_020302 [Deinococcus aerius]
MTEPFPTPQQYLEVLDELETTATQSEASYYQRVRAKYEELATKALQESVDDETPEALARSLDAGYEGLYFLQYELSKPDLDHHWRTWLESRISKYERGIEQLRGKLEEQKYMYSSPPNSVEKLAEEDAREQRQNRIKELELLKQLKTAWAERNAKLAIVASELEAIDKELIQLKD